jgi:diguanylate cyclase (GGDEF)-like protein/PAS domain S-box-containing protein
MSRREWMQASLKRPIWLAAAAMLFIGVVLVLTLSEHRWRERAAHLAEDNTRLRAASLSAALETEAARFEARSQDLAGSDSIVQFAADRPDRSFPNPRAGVDGFLLLDAGQSPRWSAVLSAGSWKESPPDTGLLKVLQSRSPLSESGHLGLGFEGDRWISLAPVVPRGAGADGWLMTFHRVPKSLLDAYGAHPVAAAAQGSEVAVLHDAGGKPLAAFAFDTTATGGGSALLLYLLLTLALLAGVGIAAAFVLHRYVRKQQSVDGRYKALIDQANDGIVIVDAESHKLLYANPALLSRLDYTNEEAARLSLLDIFADAEASSENLLARLKDASSRMALNLQQRAKSGVLIDTEVRCSALDVDGRDVFAYVTHDVSLRRKAEQQLIENQQRLDKMAHHDQLTGLPNRHYLTAFLPQAISEAKAAGAMLGVVFLDLDRFKHINDTRGHETGDKLLQEVAARLRSCVRESDVVIRMGGDEFVVIFRNLKSYDEVTQGAGRIVESLNNPIIIDQHPLQTTGSVGVSLYPRDGADMVELLKHSDTAMYQAKDRGRNNVQMFSQVMNKKLKQRVAVEASLREALRLKQLDVHYQPFVSLATRKVVGLEALIRWNHPTHGFIPPDQFIPVAEETGLIVPMGNFVIQRAFQTMAAWRKVGATLVPMSINVAPVQLQRGELLATIAAMLNAHAVKPSLIQLEMTERAIFDSRSPTGESRQDSMAKLRDLGIKIAIDDFGTGYSSLSYLKNWRVDALKIDRSFVRDLVTDSSDLAIVSAIIAIAKHLQIQVIAEGIEAYQQSEILRRLGCGVGQGFLFARPMTASQVLKVLRDNVDPAKEEEEDMLAAFSAGGS